MIVLRKMTHAMNMDDTLSYLVKLIPFTSL